MAHLLSRARKYDLHVGFMSFIEPSKGGMIVIYINIVGMSVISINLKECWFN